MKKQIKTVADLKVALGEIEDETMPVLVYINTRPLGGIFDEEISVTVDPGIDGEGALWIEANR